MSLLTQTRVKAFVAGIAASGAAYIYLQRELWASTSRVSGVLPNPPAPTALKKPDEIVLFNKETRNDLARAWNKGVDAVFVPLIGLVSETPHNQKDKS